MTRARMRGRWLGLAVFGSACAPATSGIPAPVEVADQGTRSDRSTAFVDVAVIPMDTERVLTHQTVVISDGRITALGPVEEVRVPADARRVDGRSRFLIPGLGDMHTHLGASGSANAERHLLLLVAAGVTTVRNMDWVPQNHIQRPGVQSVSPSMPEPFPNSRVLDGPDLLRLKARTASGELLGPRIYTSGPWRLDTTRSVMDNIVAYKAAGYDHVKWYPVVDWYPIVDSLVTDSLAAATRRVGIPLVGHGLEPPGGLERTLAWGFKSIEHLVPYTNDSTLAAQVAATVRAGVWNCLCPLGDAGTYPSRLEARYGVRELRLLKGTGPDSATVSMLTKAPASPAVEPAGGLRDYLVEAKALHDGGAKLLLGTDMPAWGIFADDPSSQHTGCRSDRFHPVRDARARDA